MNSVKVIQEELEKEYGLLKEYRSSADKVSSILEHCKYNEDVINNLAGLYFNVEKITLVQNDLLVSNEIIFFYLWYLINGVSTMISASAK